MRKPTDRCLLCEKDDSSKKNSHIIPKFLGKGIFEGSETNYGISIDKKGNIQKIQDIIKEDFLFCPTCEKKFGVLETYCALRLERFNQVRYSKNFRRYKNGEFEYIDCLDIDNNIFNLFIYSIVWRVSVSNNYAFGGFKLSSNNEKKLRVILNSHLETTQQELMISIEDMKVLPDHSHVMIRPDKKMRPPNSMMSGRFFKQRYSSAYPCRLLIALLYR
jgi:hypothetical protein